MRHHCLAICAPGIEDLCAAELTNQRVHVRRAFRGGVEFSASDRQLYAANLLTRTATRIVVRVARFTASTLDELMREAARVPWDQWIRGGATPSVRVTSTSSRLYHTGAIAERLEEVAGTGDAAGPLLVARLIHDRVTLSIDSSGAALYQRGWRTDGAKAPLRETLAAALVLASGWDRRQPFLDPFCGSGTIAIEAALIAMGTPPGIGRTFAFQGWPTFQPGTWASVTGEASASPATPPPVIVAADRDAGAAKAAIANAERAGVADRVEIRRAALSDLELSDLEPSDLHPAAGVGWLITNPPYGKRIAGGRDPRDLYARLGDVVRARLPGWGVAMLVADSRLAGHARLHMQERLRTENGGIPVHLLVSDPAESLRVES